MESRLSKSSGIENSEVVYTQESPRIRIMDSQPNGPKISPLYVVDGKIYEEQDVFNELNIRPESIESISVLKDNSAVSIYGSKGKNGVILVTTKKNSKAFDKN